MRRARWGWLCVVVAMPAFGAPAWADESDAWRFVVTPYLWLPSVDAELGLDDVGPSFEASSGVDDLFDRLKYAALVCGEVRHGRFGVLFDVQALGLEDEATVGNRLTREYETDVKFVDATFAATYRVVEQSKGALDVFAGGRVMHADVSLELGPGPLRPAIDREQDETWADPIVVVKGRFDFADRWGLFGYGDIGGFGVSSELTYQVMGTVFYRFNDHVAMHAGYRVFGVDFERGDFQFDATINGPLVGLSFAW